MKILIPFNNFARAGVDHDLNGRFDLPIYNSSADIFKNAISNFKGNAIFRAGFEDMLPFQDCVFVEFKFNNQQNYLLFLYANKIKFASYDSNGVFGMVLDGLGNELEVTTPYTLAQCRQLDWTQNDDVIIFTLHGFAPRKLKRLSANSFSFGVFARTADPFINLETAGTITGITQANPAVVTVVAHGYVTGDKAFIAAVVGMEQVNDQIFDVTRLTADTFSIGVNSTAYDAYSSGGTSQKLKSTAITGITQANPAVVTSTAHTLSSGDTVTIYNINGMTQVNGNTYTIDKINANSFSLRGIDSTGYGAFAASANGRVRELEDFPAKCLFYKGRLYYANTSRKVTTIYASKAGSYDDFTLTPVDVASALIFTVTDIAQPIEWLFGGDNSLIVGATDGIVAVNGGAVGAAITAESVASKPTTAPACNSVKPFAKDGLIFYVGRDGRNLYYFQYDLLTESFLADDANILSYDITNSGMTKIHWKKDKNDLIFGQMADGSLITCNFNLKEKITGWHDHSTTYGLFKDSAVITDNEGAPQFFALVLRDNGVYYIERQSKYVEFVKRGDFLEEYEFGNEAEAKEVQEYDDEAYYNMLAEQLKECNYLDNALSVSNLKSNAISYNPATGRITATSAVFAADHVGKSIVYKTSTGYERGRFLITAYVSSTVVEVTETVEAHANFYTDWYLTFDEISGLTQYIGYQVSIVADGKYIGDFHITSATLDLGGQYTYVTIGYRYTMLIKSFCMGIQLKAEHSQVTMKAIKEFGIRCVASVGGKVGSSPYRLQRVQEASNADLNYLPPLPIDGTKMVPYTDDASKDKFFYIVQDEPMPFTATAILVNANHAVTQ